MSCFPLRIIGARRLKLARGSAGAPVRTRSDLMTRDPAEFRRVLIAEARQSVRSFLVSQLLSAGFQLTEVADGTSALRVLWQEKVDIALVDVQLPGRDGLEVLKEARKLSKRIPILMITDIRQVSTAIEVLKLDADDYLTLPLSS